MAYQNYMEFLLNIPNILKSKTCLINLVLLLHLASYGQDMTLTEHHQKALEKSDAFYRKQLYDSAHYYATINYKALDHIAQDTFVVSALLQLIKTSHKIPFEDRKAYCSMVEQKAIENNQKNHLIDLYKTMGDLYFEKQNFVDAIPYYLKVDSISKSYGIRNKTVIGAMLNRAEISKLSFTYETTNMAHSLLYEALDIAKEIKAVESEHLTYIQLADINQMIREFKEAKKYIDLALPYFKKQGNDIKVVRTLLMKSAYYMGVDSLNRAEETHLESIAYLTNKDLTLDQAKAVYYYGNFLRRKKSAYAKAITQLEIAKDLFQKANKDSIELYHRTLRDLAFCNHQLGHYKEASEYYQAAYDLKIDLLEKFNRSSSKTLEAQYQNGKKEQEIALLSSQKELAEQQKKSQQNILMGVMGMTSLAGLFVFVLFKNRSKTSAKLRELDALKTNFFANISHEFRTPLTLISSPIETTLEETDLPTEKRKHFEMASRNTKRLLSLVNQLLDISKIDSGTLKLQLEKGKPAQLITAWGESFSYLAKQKNIAFRITASDKDKEGWFDRDALEKIAVNLLGNAIKYVPENGEIEVKVSCSKDQIDLEVRNTGKGLTQQQIKTIFDRFYQTDGFNDGVGIGLSLVKELTALHKGTIKVSQEEDRWTTFLVQLCTDKKQFKNAVIIDAGAGQEIKQFKADITQVPQSVPEISEDGLPILLVVEDNPDVQLLLYDTFKTTFKVITANHGEEGIKKALKYVPDIIVSDVMMPVKDGIELTKTLKKDERTSHIPIVLLTAKAGDENKLVGIEMGADDYITKPFNQKILKSKVNNLIALRIKLQARYSQEVVLRPKDIAITSVDERFLEKVQAVLDVHLTESTFTVAAFSKAVHMSRMQLHRKLKALTGLSASEFVRSQRLKLSTQILGQSDINISEVGYSVGFNDPAYFTKCFRETYSCTPSEYGNRTKFKAKTP